MDYNKAINKLVVAMISSNRSVHTGHSMRELCRMIVPKISDNQLSEMMRKIKADKRIKTTKVTRKKIYYSYRGEF